MARELTIRNGRVHWLPPTTVKLEKTAAAAIREATLDDE